MRADVRSLVSSAKPLALCPSEAAAVLSTRLSQGSEGGGTSQVLVYTAQPELSHRATGRLGTAIFPFSLRA